ncbi:MAG: hypothetical protein AB1656_17300 [Candidatus Omnitrophota bacterium]
MWRKSRGIGAAFAAIAFAFSVGIVPDAVRAQSPAYTTLDAATQRSVEELRQLLLTGDDAAMEAQLQRIVRGSGYIEPLAEIYYKLAQRETRLAILISYYSLMMDKWDSSPWASMALIQLVPLVLMSGGKLDDNLERLIDAKKGKLLAAAANAAAIGEDPRLLREDAMVNLLQLAHLRGDSIGIQELARQSGGMLPRFQDRFELAAAYAKLRNQNSAETAFDLKQWLQKYPQSDLRPFAILALFHASDANEAVRLMNEQYPDTLEALLLKNYLAGQ